MQKITVDARFAGLLALLFAAACGPATDPGADAGSDTTDAGDETVDAGTPAPPTITSFTPAKAPGGATVTLAGTGFSTTAAQNAVVFLGGEGSTDDKTAEVTAATANELQVEVPGEAASGPISVTVGGLTATTQTSFTVGTPLKLTGSTGVGSQAAPDNSFTMIVAGDGLTTNKADYTLVGAPIFGGDTVPFTVLNAGPGFLSVAAPLTAGTYFMNLAFNGETATAAEPMQIYEWRYIHDFFNGQTRGEPFVKGTQGQEVRVGFSPANPDQGQYTIELLDSVTGELKHSQVPNGSSGSGSGTFAVSYSTHTGPTGTFRARVKFVSNTDPPVTYYTTVSAATLVIQEAAP